jgi:hypothetical protein
VDFALSLQRVDPGSVGATTGCEAEHPAGMAPRAAVAKEGSPCSSKNHHPEAGTTDAAFSGVHGALLWSGSVGVAEVRWPSGVTVRLGARPEAT